MATSLFGSKTIAKEIDKKRDILVRNRWEQELTIALTGNVCNSTIDDRIGYNVGRVAVREVREP